MGMEEILKKTKAILSSKDRLLCALERRGLIPRMSDEEYIRRMWRIIMDYPLDLDNPKTFNEKLQWLKLYDRRPEYTIMVDKVKAKEYVAGIIGEEHIIPTLGVWDDPDEIDFDALPDKFVLKCNHNSGTGMFICKDKSKLDIPKVKDNLRKGLKENYYLAGREWPYKNVPRKILAEQYMGDGSEDGLDDYKVLCFGGIPELIEYHRARFTDHQTQDFYDINWNKTNISQSGMSIFQRNDLVAPKPEAFDEMIRLSKVLSNGLIHIRVDWYCIQDKLYFGELTFYDGSGFDAFDNPEDDLLLGSWITLPEKLS